MRTKAQRQDSGSALVSAIGLSAVLALVAVFATRLVLNTAVLEARSQDAMAAERGRESVVLLSVLHLADPNRIVQYGEETLIDAPHGRYRVRWWSPHGRVDINMASHPILRAALEAAGVANSESVAASIIDWRDPDDLVSLNGAESNEYRAMGASGPGNRPFRHEMELAQVLGLSEGRAECLSQYVTVSSHRRAPEPALAPVALADALSATGEAIDTPSIEVLAEPGALIGMLIEPVRPTEGGAASVLVRLTGDPDRPLLIQAVDLVSEASQQC